MIAVCFLLLILLLSFTVLTLSNMFHSTMEALDVQALHLKSVSSAQIRNELDTMFSSSLELISAIHSNQVVQHFSLYGKPSSADEHYSLYELHQNISMYSYMVEANPSLLDFAVYYPRSEVLVNRNSYYRTSSYYDSWYSSQNDISFDEWKGLIASHIAGKFIPSASNRRILIYVQSIDNSPVPGANIILVFDRSVIENTLRNLEQEDYKLAIALDGILLSGTLPDEISEAILSGGSLPENSTWQLSASKSNYLRNISYYICENSSSGFIPGLSLRRFYSIAVILLVIITLSTAALTLSSILLPIVKRYRESEAPDKSAANGSVTILKDAIDFVFSRNADKPADSEWLIVKDSLLDLLMYSEVPRDEIMDTLNRHNIAFIYPYYMLVLLTVSSGVSPDVLPGISHTCNEAARGSILNACFPIGHRRFAALLNLKEASTPYKDTVELIRTGIRETTGTEVTAYIGTIQEGSENIYRSYRDAVELSEYKIFTGSNSVLDHNSFTRANDEYYYPMDLELNLISAISRGDKEKVSSILQNIHEENFVKRQLSPYIARLLLNELAGTTLKITRGLEDSFSENPAAAVLKCDTVEDVFYTLQQIYLQVCSAQQSDTDGKRKEEFNRYIMLHYTDASFSQRRMADDFGVSQNYLSVQFKNYFGVNMNAYVNTLRVERAAEFLKETAYPILDVAIMCGFSNGDALARVFKKKYGITPSDYRSGVTATGTPAEEDPSPED